MLPKKLKHGILSGRSFVKSQPLTISYGVDGLLVMGALSIVGNNNNLFAQRLGAGDFHLAMLQFLPQILVFFMLIPIGMFTDSLKNKRIVMSFALVAAGIFFTIASISAFIPVYAVYIFLIFLSLANASVIGFYNLSWQAFFPEAVQEWKRNDVLTFRARMGMIIQLIMPLLVGAILTAIVSDQGKIAAHQVFYVIAAVLVLTNSLFIKRIKAVNPAQPKRISFTEMKTASKRLVKNKPFIIFSLCILFFHMTWHMDWTLYFIGQRNYLEMNEIMLSIAPITAMLAQLITLKFWSKLNTKKGVEQPLVYGMLGLALCPLAIIVGTSLPLSYGPFVFLTLHFLGHLGFANIALNLFQCLLKVVDEEYRSFSISIYSCMITLSNAVMPMVGVAVYRGLGGDVHALRLTFVILFFLRISAALLWILRMKLQQPQAV